MPFRPGQSGNPAGRPKGTKQIVTELELRRLAQLEGQACIDGLIRLRDDPKTPPSAVISAISILLERGYGRMGLGQTVMPSDTAVPTGVVEIPRPFASTAEWQAQATAWVEQQAQKQVPPGSNGDPTKRHYTSDSMKPISSYGGLAKRNPP